MISVHRLQNGEDAINTCHLPCVCSILTIIFKNQYIFVSSMSWDISGTTRETRRYSVWYPSNGFGDRGIELDDLRKRDPLVLCDETERVATALGAFRFSPKYILSPYHYPSLKHELHPLFFQPHRKEEEYQILNSEKQIYLGRGDGALGVNLDVIHMVYASTLESILTYLTKAHPGLPIPRIRQKV